MHTPCKQHSEFQELGTERFAAGFISKTARWISTQTGFTRSDRDDLEQELTLALLQRSPSFDPKRARWTTFVQMVVQSKAMSLLRRQNSSRNGLGPVASLSTSAGDGDGGCAEMAQAVTEDEYRSRKGLAPCDDHKNWELAHDVDVVLSKLPADLRRICVLLKTKTVSEVAAQTGIPRSTLRDSLKKVKEHFEAEGLREYFA